MTREELKQDYIKQLLARADQVAESIYHHITKGLAGPLGLPGAPGPDYNGPNNPWSVEIGRLQKVLYVLDMITKREKINEPEAS